MDDLEANKEDDIGTDIHIAAEFYKDGSWHLANIVLTQDRNYRAFAVLANVRNGVGFAGFSTGEALIPISEPRGLPDDMSPELRTKLEMKIKDDEDAEQFWLGNQSFSWVTLKELLEYDLDAPVTVRGYVSREAAQRYRETGEIPGSFAASTWTHHEGFEQIEWQVPIRESAWLIPRLIEEIRGLGDPENVRLVFGFDN